MRKQAAGWLSAGTATVLAIGLGGSLAVWARNRTVAPSPEDRSPSGETGGCVAALQGMRPGLHDWMCAPDRAALMAEIERRMPRTAAWHEGSVGLAAYGEALWYANPDRCRIEMADALADTNLLNSADLPGLVRMAVLAGQPHPLGSAPCALPAAALDTLAGRAKRRLAESTLDAATAEALSIAWSHLSDEDRVREWGLIAYALAMRSVPMDAGVLDQAARVLRRCGLACDGCDRPEFYGAIVRLARADALSGTDASYHAWGQLCASPAARAALHAALLDADGRPHPAIGAVLAWAEQGSGFTAWAAQVDRNVITARDPGCKALWLVVKAHAEEAAVRRTSDDPTACASRSLRRHRCLAMAAEMVQDDRDLARVAGEIANYYRSRRRPGVGARHLACLAAYSTDVRALVSALKREEAERIEAAARQDAFEREQSAKANGR